MILASALLLDHLEAHEEANRVRAAVEATITEDGIRTPDLGGSASTKEFGNAVAQRLS